MIAKGKATGSRYAIVGFDIVSLCTIIVVVINGSSGLGRMKRSHDRHSIIFPNY